MVCLLKVIPPQGSPGSLLVTHMLENSPSGSRRSRRKSTGRWFSPESVYCTRGWRTDTICPWGLDHNIPGVTPDWLLNISLLTAPSFPPPTPVALFVFLISIYFIQFLKMYLIPFLPVLFHSVFTLFSPSRIAWRPFSKKREKNQIKE